MSQSDRPKEHPPSDAEKAPRTDSAHLMAGRSATVAEIGRELGDLDFEPDDLLASLRPFEAEPEVAPPPAPPAPIAPAPARVPQKAAEPFPADEPSTHAMARPLPDEPSAHNPSAPPEFLPADDYLEVAEDSVDPADDVPPPRPSHREVPLSASVTSDSDPADDVPSSRRSNREVPSTTDIAANPADGTQAVTATKPQVVPRPAAPANPRPAVTANPRPAPAVTAIPRPAPSTTANPRPAPSATANPRPAPSATANPRPAPPNVSDPSLRARAPQLSPPPTRSADAKSALPARSSVEPPSLAHREGQELPIPPPKLSVPPTPSSAPASESDPMAPDVEASEDAVVLEELVVLPPARNEPLAFELERAASEHLREQDLMDVFHGLAVELTREAQAPRHPQEQAELALVNSELLAMLGELDTAREYLDALTPTPTTTNALQARQLALAAEDLPAYAQLIKAEIRNSISHESRRHLMALYSDVQQLIAQDEAERRRHLELSLRAFPSDPRFWLQRLASQGGDANAPSKLRAPSIPDSPKLTDSMRELLALRAGTAKARECAHPAGPLLRARRAWEKHDLGELLDALTELRSIDELAAGASWLHACFSAFAPEFRNAGTAFVDALLEQGDGEAELALLERRLHASSDLPTSVEAFSLTAAPSLSPADRLSLAVAVRADADTLRLVAEDAARRAPTLPLAQAIGTLHALSNQAPDAPDLYRTRLALGDLLGRSLEGHAPAGAVEATPKATRLLERLAQPLRRLEELDTADALPKIFRLLETVLHGKPEALATILTELGPWLSEAEAAPLLVLGGLMFHVAGEPERQIAALKQAMLQDGRLEVAYRSLAQAEPETPASALLRGLVNQWEPTIRRSLLELETRALDSGLLEDILSTHPTLGPFVQLQVAAAAQTSPGGWAALAARAETQGPRLFATLLEVLATGTDAQPSGLDTGAAADDPLAYTLCTALQCEPQTATMPQVQSGQLADWLRTSNLADHFPTDLDAVDGEALRALAERQPSPILAHWLRAYHGFHHGEARVFADELSASAAVENDAEFADRLVEAAMLDPNRQSTLGSIEVARKILERSPRHLEALRVVLRHDAIHDAIHKTGRTAAKLAQLLGTNERQAYAWLAITSTTYTSGADANLEQAIHLDTLVEQQESPPVWASRKLLNLALQRKDDARILATVNQLRATAARALDAATLTLRAAEASSRLEQWDAAGELLERAVDLYPEHLVALSMRAEFLEARGDPWLAANAYDSLAEAACMPTHKVAAWVQAATLFGEVSGEADAPNRATLALERAVELDATHAEATTRLRKIYFERGEVLKSEQLLTRLLMREEDGAERAEIEFARARALIDLGRIDEAQGGLERALSLVPTHEAALVLLTRLCEDRGDYDAAEQQLLRLAGLGSDPAKQADAYRRLALLYETHLEQPARAETAYREVLKREPNDPTAGQLVKLLLRLDNPTAAVTLLEELVAQPGEPTVERTRHLELARILDEVLGDRRRAEEVLERTRRRWPNDASAIEALATFYRRGKDQVAHDTLLDRSIVDARRALAQGRFDASFFQVIASVARLREKEDFSNVASATLSALEARESPLEGVGARANEDPFSDLLAPEVLTLPLRAMLRKTGWALCAAHPIDVRALRATPLAQTQPELSEHLRTLAGRFGLFEIDLHLSPALGAVCQPTSSVPATLVVGPAFVAMTDAVVRDALALRALRILSANAAALANTAPVDLWPLLVAYLSAYLPDWLPPGIDGNKITPIRERIQAVLPSVTERDMPPLAADVAASIGNRASQLGIAVQQWGSRTALLALGDPGKVLSAIAAASGQTDGLSTSAVDRQKWIVRNPEARDLAIFSVSDAYLEARSKALGSNG